MLRIHWRVELVLWHNEVQQIITVVLLLVLHTRLLACIQGCVTIT